MNSVPIIASPVSAPWIPWVLLVLLVLLGVDLLMDGSSILDVRRLFSMPERSYSENSNRLLTGIVSSLFRTGTFAMAVYVSCWQGQNMSVAVYLEIVAMIYVITVVRYLIIWLLYMIFRFAPKREVVGKRYVQFASITAIDVYIFVGVHQLVKPNSSLCDDNTSRIILRVCIPDDVASLYH